MWQVVGGMRRWRRLINWRLAPNVSAGRFLCNDRQWRWRDFRFEPYGGTMPMTKDEVFNKVKEVLVSTLAVDDAEVKPESRLKADLNAESIDFLDITFQLE